MNVSIVNLSFYFFKLKVNLYGKALLKEGLECGEFVNNICSLATTPDKSNINNYSVISSLINQHYGVVKDKGYLYSRKKKHLTSCSTSLFTNLFSYKKNKWIGFFFINGVDNCTLYSDFIKVIGYIAATQGEAYTYTIKYRVGLDVYINPISDPTTSINTKNAFFFRKKISSRGRKFYKSLSSPLKFSFYNTKSIRTYCLNNLISESFRLVLKKTGLLLPINSNSGSVSTYGGRVIFVRTELNSFFKAKLKSKLSKKVFLKTCKTLNYTVLKGVGGVVGLFQVPNYKNIIKSNQIVCDFLTIYSITRNFNATENFKVLSSFFFKESSKYLSVYKNIKVFLINNGFFEVVNNGFLENVELRTLKYSLVTSLVKHIVNGNYLPVFEFNNVFKNSKVGLKVNEFLSLCLVYPYFNKTKLSYTLRYKAYTKSVYSVYLNFFKKTLNGILYKFFFIKSFIRWNCMGGFKWERFSSYYFINNDCSFYLKFGKFNNKYTKYANKNYSLFGVELLFKHYFLSNINKGRSFLFKKGCGYSNLQENFFSILLHKKTMISYIKERLSLILKLKWGLKLYSLKLLDVFNYSYFKKVFFSIKTSTPKGGFFMEQLKLLIFRDPSIGVFVQE